MNDYRVRYLDQWGRRARIEPLSERAKRVIPEPMEGDNATTIMSIVRNARLHGAKIIFNS